MNDINEEKHAIIGTLAEGSVHRALKYFVDSNEAHHECKIDGFVLDVFNGSEITEIQTRSFQYLIPKLRAFSDKYSFTVLCPLVKEKLSVRVQKHTGEHSMPRRSPKKERIEAFARELCAISDFIKAGLVRLRFVEISATEFRLYVNNRRGAVIDRVLDDVISVRDFYAPSDYAPYFLPAGLGMEFTAKDYVSATRLPGRAAYYGIKLMQSFGFVELKGKRGREHVYETVKVDTHI